MTQLWGWRRNCSSCLIHKRIVLHSTWAVMLSLNYILPRQSSQPLLVSLLRHRAKCHLEIHHLRVPLTPQMHFQLSELCMAFKQSCISIFPFFFHCWEHIRKDCMFPKLLFSSRKIKAEVDLNNLFAFKIQKYSRTAVISVLWRGTVLETCPADNQLMIGEKKKKKVKCF